MAIGVSLTLTVKLWIIVLGVALFTVGFFGAHSIQNRSRIYL
jgi:hypothetical protein